MEGVSEWVRLVYWRIGPAMNPQCNHGSLHSRARRKYIRVCSCATGPSAHVPCAHLFHVPACVHDTSRISFDGGFKRYALRLFGSQFWFAIG